MEAAAFFVCRGKRKILRKLRQILHSIVMQMLTLEDVSKRLQISRMTIWRHRKAGKFPKPVDVGDGYPRFIEDEITAWCEARRMKA